MSAIDDALVETLRADETLMAEAYEVGHGRVPRGTQTPYIIVKDLVETPEYAFGNRESHSHANYEITAIAENSNTESAQSITARLNKRIHEVLQDVELDIDGRDTLIVSRGPRVASFWETLDEERDFFHDKYRWEVWSQPQ